jgi:hypothetical protein
MTMPCCRVTVARGVPVGCKLANLRVVAFLTFWVIWAQTHGGEVPKTKPPITSTDYSLSTTKLQHPSLLPTVTQSQKVVVTTGLSVVLWISLP